MLLSHPCQAPITSLANAPAPPRLQVPSAMASSKRGSERARDPGRMTPPVPPLSAVAGGLEGNLTPPLPKAPQGGKTRIEGPGQTPPNYHQKASATGAPRPRTRGGAGPHSGPLSPPAEQPRPALPLPAPPPASPVFQTHAPCGTPSRRAAPPVRKGGDVPASYQCVFLKIYPQ